MLHTCGGYLIYAATTFKYVFDYKPGQVYWCTADIGWITGHTYVVYGPLANAATSVMVGIFCIIDILLCKCRLLERKAGWRVVHLCIYLFELSMFTNEYPLIHNLHFHLMLGYFF